MALKLRILFATPFYFLSLLFCAGDNICQRIANWIMGVDQELLNRLKDR